MTTLSFHFLIALTSFLRSVPGQLQQQRRQTGGFKPQVDSCSGGGTGGRGEYTPDMLSSSQHGVSSVSFHVMHDAVQFYAAACQSILPLKQHHFLVG